jgi:hypothetical protein
MITKRLACKKLGIVYNSYLSVPQITPLLSDILSGLAERSLPVDPYYYLNASGDPDARALLKVYHAAWKQVRDILPLEAFCVAAGVEPSSILDSIVNSIARLNALNAAVKLSASQPEVVQTTIEAARDVTNGHKDRRLHMQVSGLMPMPKGSKTVIQVNTNASATSAPVQQAIVVPAPAPEQTVRRLSERLHSVKGALPATAESLPVGPSMTQQRVEDAVLVEED